MTESMFFKVFQELGPFHEPEEKMRVGFRESFVLMKSQRYTNKKKFRNKWHKIIIIKSV
jgi:hypothetical protein